MFAHGHWERSFCDDRGGHCRPLLLSGKAQVCGEYLICDCAGSLI